ncbi:MAG: amidohydrolase family protein [Microthrixaceae bacterium]
MHDTVIRNATIVDGTGAPGRPGAIGIRDGRIAEVLDEPTAAGVEAAEVIDAEGLVLAPGFIDPHTHYDAQLMWDPFATPSNVHGVTTVIAGNCGFTLAPLAEGDADYTRRMMAKVEGMPLEALEDGVDWSWSTFGEYLDRLDGTLAVNAGSSSVIAHSAAGRWAPPRSATRPTTPRSPRCDACSRRRSRRVASGSPPHWPGPTPTATVGRWRHAGPAAPNSWPWRPRPVATRARRWSMRRMGASTASTPTT